MEYGNGINLDDTVWDDDDDVSTDDEGGTGDAEPSREVDTPDDLEDDDDDEQEEPEKEDEDEYDTLTLAELEKAQKEKEDTDEEDEEEEQEDEEGKENDAPEISAMQRLLAMYDITDGNVSFDDGSSVKFDELNSEQQFDVLKNLIDTQRPSVEDEYSLTEEEIDVVNMIRTEGKTFDQIVQERSQATSEIATAMEQVEFADYADKEQFPDDMIYVRSKLMQNPELTNEMLKEALEVAKQNPLYESDISMLRSQMVELENYKVEQQRQANQAAYNEELDEQRYELVNSVRDIDTIADFVIDDASKNEVLGDMLEVNEDGNSEYMELATSDPEFMFNAMWFHKYGKEAIAREAEVQKQRVLEAYERGKQEMANGYKAPPLKVNKNKDKGNSNKPTDRSPAKKYDLGAQYLDDVNDVWD